MQDMNGTSAKNFSNMWYKILNALVTTNTFKVLYHMSGKVLALVPFISCMAGKVFVMTHGLHEYHIKVKKSGGAFKLSQQFSCTTIMTCLDNDLKRVEGQKKVLASMTCKNIAI